MRNNLMKSRWVLLTLMVAFAATQAFAGGPLLIYNAANQQPYAYGPAVTMYTDLGNLGALTNASGDALVSGSANQWSSVPTSSFSASVVGDFSALGLPDITGANAGLVIGPNNGNAGITVIYDTDGTVTQNFLGAPPGVLGIATPEYASGATLTESWVVLNGSSINPGDLPSASSWAGVVTHEMGHSINLAHTQTNGAIIFFGDNRGPGTCGTPYGAGGLNLSHTETMYPYIDVSPGSTGVYQQTVTHPDDIASLSNIYPAPGYPASHATIEGVVYATNGTTPRSGVNVIARNIANPWADANSALSGDYTQGGVGNDGRFKLTGLTPGANYVLYVDQIVNGGYSTTPLQPLGAAEEYWNQFESNSTAADPPCDFTVINVPAGGTHTANMMLNSNSVAAPVISASPPVFNFSILPNTVDSAALVIQNVGPAGAANLNWILTEDGGDSPWLSVAPTSGSTPQAGFDLPLVTVDATGLSPGLYNWDIEIASNDTGSPLVYRTVNLEVLPNAAPEIHVYAFPMVNPGGQFSLNSLPDGTGAPLSAAQFFGGASINGTLGIQLTDENGDPIPNFPGNLITVKSQLGGWVQCPGFELHADGPTAINGLTTMSGSLFAGGFSAPGELMQVVVDHPDVASITYQDGLPGLEYFVNGADSDGNFVVNLSDVADFAVVFYGGYDYAMDFVWDGVVNLSDVAKLGVGVGKACVGTKAADDEVAEVKTTGTIGVSFDAAGTTYARTLEIGERTEAFVVVQGPAAERGVAAFDTRVRTSSNVTVHSQEIVGEGFNLSTEGDFVVGLAAARHAKAAMPVQLVKLTVSVTDDQPAYFWVEPSRGSEFDLPTVAFDGQIHAARPVSGDITAPVASLNDAEFALAGGNTPNPQLSMGIAPNPFNPMTKISFSLPASGKVDLRIYDARGQLVTTLRSETMEAGAHQVTWNGTDQSGRNMSSGIYFSKLQTPSGTLLQKMMLMK